MKRLGEAMTALPKNSTSGPSGLRLAFGDGRAPLTALEEINKALAPLGSRVWPIACAGTPQNIRGLLAEPNLRAANADAVMQHFLLTRMRLLELIAEAGRKPQVSGGGEMSTFVVNHNYSYPRLFVVEPGTDYSRFDRFHVNTSDSGTGADEVMQVLLGGGVTILQHPRGRDVATLHVDTTDKNGWCITYDGGCPHIGSLSRATEGTKVLMQVVGPARWVMSYEDDR